MRSIRIHVLTMLMAATFGLAPVLTLAAKPAHGPTHAPAATAKKSNNGCQFTQTPTLWTLKASCTTNVSITVPDGVTLDGNHKTIRLKGTLTSFDGPGVEGLNAGVVAGIRNLTVDGASVHGPCGSGPKVYGISLGRFAGELTDVTVENLVCGPAIDLGAPADGPRLAPTLNHVTVRNVTPAGKGASDGAIRLFGAIDVTITDSTVRDIRGENYGVYATGGATADIGGTTIENIPAAAVFVDDGAVSPHGDTITKARTGFSAKGAGASLLATNNTIVGPGKVASLGAGVRFADGATGEVDSNTISNYFDSSSTDQSCGILLDATAGSVTIGTNTFPDPPGNEQNVCDNRP